jgi:hypothetical protein
MLTATVLFLNENTKKNKNLIEQLKSIMAPAIRRGRLTFSFKVISNADIAKTQKYGITKFPAMILDKQPYNDIASIMNEIRNRIGQSKGEVAAKSDEEMLHEFQMGEFSNLKRDAAGNVIENGDEAPDMGRALQEKMQSAMKQRADAARGYAGNKNADQAAYMPRQQTRRDDTQEDEPRGSSRPAAPRGGPRPAPPREDNIAQNDDVFGSITRTRSAAGEGDKDDMILRAMFDNNAGND